MPGEIEPRTIESAWYEWPNRTLPDGRLLALQPLLFGDFRLHVIASPQASRSQSVYDFADAGAAAVALGLWDGRGDPEGWVRHKPSNRRRPDGDPAREHVAP